jgi:hypothetical protein
MELRKIMESDKNQKCAHKNEAKSENERQFLPEKGQGVDNLPGCWVEVNPN